MVTISASANSELFMKLATLAPSWPRWLVTSGLDLPELRVFLQHERLFQQSPLDDAQVKELCVATNCYPLELALLCDAHNALHVSGAAPVTLQRCIELYEQGDGALGVPGRVQTFGLQVAAFDQRVRSEPAALERLVCGVVCMKLELSLLTFPYAVMLNLAICYRNDAPQSVAFTELSRPGGPPQYICPVTPAALQAAVAFYAPEIATEIEKLRRCTSLAGYLQSLET